MHNVILITTTKQELKYPYQDINLRQSCLNINPSISNINTKKLFEKKAKISN